MKTRAKGRRGTFLIEVMVWTVMLGAVMLITGEIVVTCMRQIKLVRQRDTMIHRVDTALDELRRDAWSASSFSATGRTAEFIGPGGIVTWSMQSSGKLVRADSAGEREWLEMPDVQFAMPRAGTMELSFAPTSARQEKVWLVSARTLLPKEGPR